MTVGIIGLGLIGGSIGLALREPGRRVIGVERDPDHARVAAARFCVDEVVKEDDLGQAEVIFVAVPPRATLDAVRSALAASEAVITDCASVKSSIVEPLADVARFVGGHPMAGHEKSGPGFATGWMFRNARWIITPGPNTSKTAITKVETLVKAMGATPVRLNPLSHDRHVALLSHLPHVLAAILVRLGRGLDNTEAGGGSWRDLTRVGGADPGLWTEILLGNRREAAQILKEFGSQADVIRQMLEAEDEGGVRSFLEEARRAKENHGA